MPTRSQRNAALRQSIPQEELDKLMRYNLEIGDEYDRAETSAGLRAQGLGAYGPTTVREGQLTPMQEKQMNMSVLKMLTEIVKAEDDYAKAVQPDFKKTMAGSILDFYVQMAKANAAAMGPQKKAQIDAAGDMAKGELNRLSKLEEGIAIDKTAWGELRQLQGALDAAGYDLGAVSSQSAFGSDMKEFLTTSPEQGAARLYHLSRATGFPVDQLIDATKASLTAGGAEDPALNSMIEAMSEDAIQNTLAAQKAEERMNAAVRKVESGLVGTGSYGRKGEGIIMSLLGTTGALRGGKMDQDAVATLLGYPDTDGDGKPGPIPENPSAVSAREFIEKNFGGGEDEWARRTTDEWARAVQRDPAFVSYAKAAERKPGEFVRNGQVLQHRLPDIYDRMRADYRSGNLQGMGAPARTEPSVIQERVMEPQRRRLFDRWRQRRASEAEAPAETTPEAEAGDLENRWDRNYVGDGRIGTPEATPPEEAAPVAPAAAVETLPPGEYDSGTEGWADYKVYQEEGPSGPVNVFRFIHPTTGKMVTVTKESDPEAYWAIRQKAFGLEGGPTGSEGAQPPAETPAGTPVDEYGFPMQSDVGTGEDVAPAAAPAGGLPDLGTLAAPPPTASGEPAQDQGYLSGLRGEGGGFIGGPMDQDPMGKALREGAKREQGRHWLNANKASLGTDSAGFPIPPTNNHPLFQEWLTITDPEGAARRAELLAERDADEARRAQEATAREAEGAVTQEQADAANVVGDRDRMLADQSAFEQTREPTRMAPGPEGHIVGTAPTEPAIPETDPDEPRADLAGQSAPTTQSFQREEEVDYPRAPTDAEYDAEAEAAGSPFTVRGGEEVLRMPQETMDPEDEVAAAGGEIGSSMDPTQGGMRAGVEGGTAFEQTSLPSAPHPRGASVSAKTAANPNHDQAAVAPKAGTGAAASKAMADALRKSAQERRKDTGIGAR
jgi:hypothetical protein